MALDSRQFEKIPFVFDFHGFLGFMALFGSALEMRFFRFFRLLRLWERFLCIYGFVGLEQRFSIFLLDLLCGEEKVFHGGLVLFAVQSVVVTLLAGAAHEFVFNDRYYNPIFFLIIKTGKYVNN